MPQFASREEYERWKSGHKDTSADETSGSEGPVSLPVSAPKAGWAAVPAWTWVFVVLCIAIPIVSLGGAIPGAIGAGAAAGCYSVAKNDKSSTGARVALCAAITVGAWIVFVVAMALLASLTR